MSDLSRNLNKAEDYLKRFRKKVTGHYINGQMIPTATAETTYNFSPVDNTRMGEVVMGTSSDVDAACEAAENAFSDWRDMPGAERKKLLNHFADMITERAEEIALVESVDSGQCIRYMQQAAIRGAANFRYFADKAPEARNGQALYQDTHTNITMRTPIGPVGIITPWNTPFMLSTWKIAPALAAGCTIVHKPAGFTPLSAMLLAEISRDAGIPDGVWNTVHGAGSIVGKRITEHPAIKAIALVGDSETGKLIMQQSAGTLKRMHLELGGKNPMIVFNDADFDRALDAAIFMLYSLNGQRCTSSSRLLIQSGIRDKFISVLQERVKKLRVGHPLDPQSEVGPLVHRGHFNKVASYTQIAQEDGATVAVGGKARIDLYEGKGNFFEPTLFINASNDMRIAQEEIFGPVLTTISFDTEEEAIQMANDSIYGLAGYIWTNDATRAMRMAKHINVGMLWINSENNRNLSSPFGGTKMSGIGRDGGDYSFDFYMETKNVCFAHGIHNVPVIGQ